MFHNGTEAGGYIILTFERLKRLLRIFAVLAGEVGGELDETHEFSGSADFVGAHTETPGEHLVHGHTHTICQHGEDLATRQQSLATALSGHRYRAIAPEGLQ